MATNDSYISKSDGTRIDPAIASNQVTLAQNLMQNSDDGGVEVLTIASNVANGADQACRTCIFWTPDATVYFLLNDGSAEAADANDALLPASTPLSMPVQNTNQLRFYGSADGEKVYIVYRN